MLVKGIQRMTNGVVDEFVRARAVAQNQANLDTPGFKQTLHGVRQGVLDRWRDDTHGPLKETGRGLDVAAPPGVYFEVEKDGQAVLTTRGDLRMDPQGFLTVGSGEKILDRAGNTIKVESLDSTTIDQSGNVYSDRKIVATLNRVRVDEVDQLGGTLFTPKVDTKIAEDTGELSIGSLTASNADLTRNQTDLIATIHRAQIYTQAATLQDGTIDRAIRALLGN